MMESRSAEIADKYSVVAESGDQQPREKKKWMDNRGVRSPVDMDIYTLCQFVQDN